MKRTVDRRELVGRDQDLVSLIKSETNKKEKARLEDEQAAIRLVLRLFARTEQRKTSVA